MTHPVCFVDTETTGLDPDLHEIWEVGLITPDGCEYRWFLPVDLGRADPVALRIGRFYERYPNLGGLIMPLAGFARDFARKTRGLHLAGAVVSFDEQRLRRLLRANGAAPDWHYHLIDVEALAIGYLSANYAGGDEPLIAPPWKSDQLTAGLGLKVDEADKHTALGDARWAKAIYDKVMASD